MEKKVLTILLLLASTAFSAIVVGDANTYPRIVTVSTEEVTLSWVTSEQALTSINCSAPGLDHFLDQVETDPTTAHSYVISANFSSEGNISCTTITFPLNDTAVTKHFDIPINCEGVRLELLSPSVMTAAYFTRPKGTGPYTLNTSVKIRNACIDRAVPSLTINSPSGMTMKAEADTLYGLNVLSVPVTITVPDSVQDGLHQGSIRFSANGSTVTAIINVTVHWPGPRLETEAHSLGNVVSGTQVSEHIDIVETMGYSTATDVYCEVRFQDQDQKTQTQRVGTIDPFGKKRCSFTLDLPERNVRIGNYSFWVKINSTNAGKQEVRGDYTIPAPYMLLTPKSLDLGQLTFEPGKDSTTAILTITENGKFTPIEGIEFELLEGETGWISLPLCDYVSPGGQTNCTFKVALNSDANIGTRKWVFGISSKYTEQMKLEAKAEIYFIGVEDAITTLESSSDYTIMDKFQQAETLKTNTIVLIEGLKEGNIGISDTATVISMYSGVVSLLSQTESAHKLYSEGNYMGAGRAILGAKMALEKISSSYRSAPQNSSKTIRNSAEVYAASAELWSIASGEILEKVESEAVRGEQVSYRRAAEYYSMLSEIYGDTDPDKASGFSVKTESIGYLYSDSIEKAGKIRLNADKFILSAQEGTIGLGGSRFILNPFSYTQTVEDYKKALADYEAAAQLYKTAGQQNELNILLSELSAAEQEYEFADRFFIIGSIALAMVLVLAIFRVTIGLQQYREDEEDNESGDIMVR